MFTIVIKLNFKPKLSNAITIDSWVKFQEDVEEGGKRWSKPFVPALQFTALAQLRHCLHAGVVMLDAPGEDLDEVIGEKSLFRLFRLN